jgi:hypothetical protein
MVIGRIAIGVGVEGAGVAEDGPKIKLHAKVIKTNNDIRKNRKVFFLVNQVNAEFEFRVEIE